MKNNDLETGTAQITLTLADGILTVTEPDGTIVEQGAVLRGAWNAIYGRMLTEMNIAAADLQPNN